MPLIEEVLTAGGATWQDLSAIGVGIGPGNFTGIRISVAAARGLGLALRIPVVGVSHFDAMALGYDKPVVCSVAAPRAKLYVQVLNDARHADGVLCDIDNIPLPNPKAEAAAIGSHADEIARLTGGQAITAKYPTVVAIAQLAALRMHNVNLQRPAPMYLRPADAAPSRHAAPVILAEPQ
jgi:tRNA threonylcarbamoyl adenosine modification protein YeaZ